jgi:hypothetical protein
MQRSKLRSQTTEITGYPIAPIRGNFSVHRRSFDHHVGAGEQRWRSRRYGYDAAGRLKPVVKIAEVENRAAWSCHPNQDRELSLDSEGTKMGHFLFGFQMAGLAL